MLNIPQKGYLLGDLQKTAEVFWWQKPAFQDFNYSGVYVIYEKDDQVLYVGESQDITNRLQEHREKKEAATSDYLDHFYRIEIFKADHFDRLINEIYLINELNVILNTRHVVDKEALTIRRNLYLASKAHIERSDIEKEAIESGCEPETQVLIELLDSIKEKDEDFYYNTSYYDACQEWKKKYMPVILERIRNYSNLEDVEILLQAREYAKALDDSLISGNNIFHPDNWSDLRKHLIDASLDKKEAYSK